MVSLDSFIPGILICAILSTIITALPESKHQIDEDLGERAADDPAWYRLPEFVIPDSYELWILPELGVGKFTYEGRVKIDLRVFKKTDSLIVHVKGLEIRQKKSKVLAISDDISVEATISDQQHDTKRQFYILSLKTDLQPGNYSLSLSFAGEVVDDVLGFYRSSHDVDNKRRWLGFTQFSPTFARAAFPCLDEPYLKATYRIHLGHYANETVTGNTVAEKIEEIKPGYFLTTFAKTPRMSTYLVGWSIHDFKYSNASNGTTFGLWTRENMKGHGSRALNEGTKIYDALSKWIDVDNPIKKMEEIAVPDFYFSAMENWGMVTFRESVVLWKENFAPILTIHRGLNTIAHEFAHTWFGNIVTPKFWNVAWLKEGFATFFGHYGQSLVSNDSGIMELFAVEVLQSALLDDSIQHNRTMNGRAVGSPDSILASMDFVAYKKGSSIIRMIQHIIGDWAFHRGLQSYVDALKYSYATPEDLYQHLQYFSDQSNVLQTGIKISDVMETWTNQPGYPVVTITRNYTTGLTEISQERFGLNRTNEDFDPENSRWWIPVNFAAVKSDDPVEASPTSWIRSQDKSILIATINSTDTLLYNINQVHYYRVNYDETNWQRLIQHLSSQSFDTISEANRASLIDDSFNLARAGYINYSIAFDLSRYLIQEKDYGPWLAASNSFAFLNIMLSGIPNVQRQFQEFINYLIKPIYDHVIYANLSTDGLRSKLLQNLIFSTSCSVDNANCIYSANLEFKNWLAGKTLVGEFFFNGTVSEISMGWHFTSTWNMRVEKNYYFKGHMRINPEKKGAIYCTGIRSGSEGDWRRILEIFLSTELHTEQELLINALGCTNNSVLVKELLNYSFYDGPEVRKQYRLAIFNAVLAGHPENVEHVMDFVSVNLEKIKKIKDPFPVMKILTAIKNRVVREEHLKKFNDIVEGNIESLGPSIESARKAVKFAEESISWIKIYAPSIAKWLRRVNLSSDS